ncbi:DUF4861 family protein [Fulvivirga sp. 29W222]|uniref:DUF4861 family protein n=1 Tax=Fulvivirga marina TaxID=2494733 RepID=A0A937G258_9BACT|nr:DUF4861 family protein [Fulvivirga marina]MBL6449262.1 DUF4861 family protein [Fulvivirga marina]
MTMNKLLIAATAACCFLSCKSDKAKSNVDVSENETEVQKILVSRTYAELSVKEGGNWNDGRYEGGHFKNITEFEWPGGLQDHAYYLRYEGPGWENSQVGYRLYLDWRNAIDIFGKKVDTVVLNHVGLDGFDSYHENSEWGQDILKVGKSLGIGSYGRLLGDSVVHFQKVLKTMAKINNADSTSSIDISYAGWQSGSDTVDLATQLTIYPQGRYTKVSLDASKAISGICTGIVKFDSIPLMKKEGQEWGYIATYGAQTLVNEQDQLGMAIFYKKSETQEVKEGDHDHLVVFNSTEEPVTYYFLGAWSQEKTGIKNELEFVKHLDGRLSQLDKNDKL